MKNIKTKTKKEVIAYVHTHWDREWYREYEIFRLRLVKVFDNVLFMLENNLLPSFYFDGQVSALLDYLEIRPENESVIRQLIKDKRLFIGPFYCLVDEFLTDGICFRKNLELGMKIAQDFGCTDFVGYLADTFGHSQNVPLILQEFGIDKAVVWRGCPEDLPAEFIFNGVNTVNLVRGYFMDIFATDNTLEEKAAFLKKNLDLIAEKSQDVLLLPIGADHLGVPENLLYQIDKINSLQDDYEIHIGTLFEYFDKVKFKHKFDDELRDNSNTFILQGSYSSRMKLKQLNTLCSYKLDLANKIQLNFCGNYDYAIEYAYKLLLQNQAHDGICGCSTDLVHEENIIRYKKVLQVADTIINEIASTLPKNLSISFQNTDKYKLLEVKRTEIEEKTQVLSKKMGFPDNLLYNTLKIPVTEDYTQIYTLLKEYNSDGKKSDIETSDNFIKNSNIKIEVADGQINLYDKSKCYKNFVEFIRCKDIGDSYNFGPVKNDIYEVAKIKSAKVITNGPLRAIIRIYTSFFIVDVSIDKLSKLLNFKIKWLNVLSNKLWQVRFNLNSAINEVYSEDMNLLIKRKFDSNYKIRENLPTVKGKEVKTNTAPMQRFVWTNGFGVITDGLSEYEVFEKSLMITILRSTGIISNQSNPARTTPAGPPIEVPGLQQIGENSVEFNIGFFPIKDWVNQVEAVYPQTFIF